MELLYLVLGLFLGALPAYFWARFRYSKPQEGLSKAELNRDYVSREQYKELKLRLQEMEQQLSQKNAAYQSLNKQHITEAQKRINLQEQLEQQKTHFETAQQTLKLQFQELADRLFEEKTQKFKEQNASSIQHLLQPLQRDLKEFKERVDTQHKDDIAQYSSLEQQIKGLAELHQQMSSDTQNLTQALRGQAQMQGAWGELVLEQVLKAAGLRRDYEYSTQESFQTAAGRLRPDVLLKLPDNKTIIIDAKTSLVAYERYCNAADEQQRQAAIAAHCKSLLQHVQGLSKKNYQHISELKSLDFVLLFVPIEAAFALAVEHQPGLIEEAFKANVMLVSPTTLLATTRTIANIWQQERQNANALEIADRGGKLYDKFVGFVDDLKEVQKRVNQAQSSLDEAFSKLQTGKGNLHRQAEQLRELGAKASKQLDKGS